MSLKVWEAYRIKKGYELWTVMHDIRIKGQQNALKELKLHYHNLIDQFQDDEMRAAFADEMYTDKDYARRRAAEKDWGLLQAHDYVFQMFSRQMGSSLRSPYDLHVSVNVRKYRGRYLLIPYPGSGILGDTLRFLKKHPALEDYHFQNASDKSAKCSDREWKARGKAWDKLLQDDVIDDNLSLDIVNLDNFSSSDPWMDKLLRAYAKKRKAKQAATKK